MTGSWLQGFDRLSKSCCDVHAQLCALALWPDVSLMQVRAGKAGLKSMMPLAQLHWPEWAWCSPVQTVASWGILGHHADVFRH